VGGLHRTSLCDPRRLHEPPGAGCDGVRGLRARGGGRCAVRWCSHLAPAHGVAPAAVPGRSAAGSMAAGSPRTARGPGWVEA
jgi:hypothetical protein